MDDLPSGEPAGEPQPTAERRSSSLGRWAVLIAVCIVAFDQSTKSWAVAALSDRDPVQVVGDLVQLRLVRNPGAAFSFATGATWIFTVLATGVSVVIVRISRQLGHRGWTLALGLLLGGAVGNLIDRLLREPGIGRGHVVDFVALPHWPVFNVADSSIVCAAVLIGWLGVRGIGIDGRTDDAPQVTGGADAGGRDRVTGG